MEAPQVQMGHQEQFQQQPNQQQHSQMNQMGGQQQNAFYQRGEPQGNAQPNQPQSSLPQQAQVTLYVGELAKDVTEEQLYQIFSSYGQLNLKIVKDRESNESKGYAFVNFQDQQNAISAYEALNYKIINGKCIRIMFNQKDQQTRQQDQNNIFIKNIDKQVNSRLLYDHFSQIGKIISCKVASDEHGESKGFGFVQFQTAEEAQNAINQLNNTEFCGKTVFVGPFIKNTQRQSSSENYNNLYVNGLPDEIDEQDLIGIFQGFGKIISLVTKKDKKSRPFAFVCYQEFEDAKKAKETLHDSEYKGCKMQVVRFENKSERLKKLQKEYLERKRKQAEETKGCNLYVKNLDLELTSDQLRSLFGRYGEIVSCKIMTEKQYVTGPSSLGEQQKSKGFGFVCFKNPQDAERAKNELSKITINDKHIYVNFAEAKEQRLNRLQSLVQKYGSVGFSNNFNQQHNQMQIQYQQYMQYYQMMMYQQMYAMQQYPMNMMRQQYHQNPQMRMGRFAGMNQMQQQHSNRQTLGLKVQVQNQMRQGQMRRQNQQRNQDIMQQQQQQEQQLLNPQELQGKSQQDQQQIIGEKLYKLIFDQFPQMAGKITGMLLEMDIQVLIQLLRNPKLLNEKIKEAVDVLEQYEKNKN